MKKVIFILLAGLLMAASATVSVQAKGVVRLYRNQVGCYPEQEKVIVVEGTNPGSKKVVIAQAIALTSQLTRKDIQYS